MHVPHGRKAKCFMSAVDDEFIRKVKQWLSYADEDLRLARHALTLSSGSPYRLIAYHAQQCAEKHIKAYLVHKRVDFPYTHNISHLLELCANYGSWAETLQDAEELTPYSITTRYPGEDEAVTKEEAVRAVDVASRVREVIRDVLMQEGIAVPEEPPL